MLEEHITHTLDLIALLRFGRCYGSKVCVMCDDSIPTLFISPPLSTSDRICSVDNTAADVLQQVRLFLTQTSNTSHVVDENDVGCHRSNMCVMCSTSVPTLFQHFFYDHIPTFLYILMNMFFTTVLLSKRATFLVLKVFIAGVNSKGCAWTLMAHK